MSWGGGAETPTVNEVAHTVQHYEDSLFLVPYSPASQPWKKWQRNPRNHLKNCLKKCPGQRIDAILALNGPALQPLEDAFL